jgi:hypothetical protein
MNGTRKDMVGNWSADDVIEAVRAEDGETYLTESQANQILRKLHDTPISEEKMENAAVALFGDIPEVTEICSLCGNTRRADTMHLHEDDLIGHDCCWDDRLYASE